MADSQLPVKTTSNLEQEQLDQPEQGTAQRFRDLWTQVPNLAVLAGVFLLSNYTPDTMGRPQHQ